MITFVSACYGKYDTIKQPVHQNDVEVDEWVLVTDEADIYAPGWRVVVEPRPHVHPNVAAKIPKFRPDIYAPDAEVTVWVDASSLVKETLASTVIKRLNESTDGWTMFPHPNRVRITDEVVASRGLTKYDDLPLEDQVEHYLQLGFPDGDSLWATGVIGRDNRNITRNQLIGDSWLHEVVRWGFQDQLSFPYVVWKEQLKITPLGVDLWEAKHIWFDGHGRP